MSKFFHFFKKVSFHPNPVVRTCITFVYCGIGIVINFFVLQVFCMPVMYAGVMCIAFYLTILILPFVGDGWVKNGLYFFLGTGVPICVYCILFLGDCHPIGFVINYLLFIAEILFFGVGLVAFIPFYLLYNIRGYKREASAIGLRFFRAGLYLPLLALLVYEGLFISYVHKVRLADKQSTSQAALMAKIEPDYFAEKLLGLRWKYHTCLSYALDGWRPPMHDPFLVVGLWINGMLGNDLYQEPGNWPKLNMDAIKCYKEKFPDKPLKMNCPCSYCRDGVQYLHIDLNKLGKYD